LVKFYLNSFKIRQIFQKISAKKYRNFGHPRQKKTISRLLTCEQQTLYKLYIHNFNTEKSEAVLAYVMAASGEPPLLLASSVHCAMREAIRAARREFAAVGGGTGGSDQVTSFQMDVPATMPAVKELCGLDVVERYLESFSATTA
jgi:hypothetical protein